MTDPYLRDPFGGDGRASLVPEAPVERAVQMAREEEESAPSLGAHVEADLAKARRPTLWYVEIDEQGRQPLASASPEELGVCVMRIGAVKMALVVLAGLVACDLSKYVSK